MNIDWWNVFGDSIVIVINIFLWEWKVRYWFLGIEKDALDMEGEK